MTQQAIKIIQEEIAKLEDDNPPPHRRKKSIKKIQNEKTISLLQNIIKRIERGEVKL